MITRATILALGCSAFAFGCSAEESSSADEQQEIIDNLVQAGFPANDIMVVGGEVFVGRDARVSLEASREMLVPANETAEQYRTTNLMSGKSKVCINPSAAFSSNATLMSGLTRAVDNYNAQPLVFDFQIGGTGCQASISITTTTGAGGSAGFPTNGNPYAGPVYIGTGTTSYGVAVVEHVITHELGHCVGFRHSDYYNRTISCGSGGNEGTAGVGAILIPGTSGTAVVGGSLMNSCFRSSESGNFTSSDLTALNAIY